MPTLHNNVGSLVHGIKGTYEVIVCGRIIAQKGMNSDTFSLVLGFYNICQSIVKLSHDVRCHTLCHLSCAYSNCHTGVWWSYVITLNKVSWLVNRPEGCYCSGTIELLWTLNFLCCQTVSCHKSFLSVNLTLSLFPLSGCYMNTCPAVLSPMLLWAPDCFVPTLAELKLYTYTIITNGKAQGDYRCILKTSKQLRNLLESNNQLRLLVIYFSFFVCNMNFW